MEKEFFWTLLGKYLDGEMTEEERKMFERQIREDKAGLSYLIEVLEEEWKKTPVKDKTREERLNNKWNHLSDRLSQEQQSEEDDFQSATRFNIAWRKKIVSWGKVAAVILGLLGLSYYFFQDKLLSKQEGQHEIVVENGHKKHVVLPDGTSAWLNAGSKLTYNDEFGKGNRKIFLEGEALFNVEKDAGMPFVVSTRDLTIKVLGTVFNIEAYPEDHDIRTTLISGKVQVLLREYPGKKILLSPHEKLTVNTEKGLSSQSKERTSTSKGDKNKLQVIPNPNTLNYQVQTLPAIPMDSISYTETAWIHDQLAFVNEPFGNVAKKLERKYDVQIIFEDTGLKNIVMSGIFKKETVKEALHVLQMITKFNYRIKGDRIYMRK